MECIDFSKKCGDEKMLINKYEDAINRYNFCLEIGSDNNHLVLLNRCLAYLYLDKYDEALNDAKESIKLNPDYARAWSRLGSCLLALNKQEDAKMAFSKAYELNPSNDEYKRLSNNNKVEEVYNNNVEEVKNDKEEEVNSNKEEVEFDNLEEDKELEELINKIKNITEVKEKIDFTSEIERMIPKNGLMEVIYNKMMNNKNLLNMLDNNDFQNKINNYSSNPLDAIKDPQMLNIMNEIMNEIQLK